jgi:hypothetical protein
MCKNKKHATPEQKQKKIMAGTDIKSRGKALGCFVIGVVIDANCFRRAVECLGTELC